MITYLTGFLWATGGTATIVYHFEHLGLVAVVQVYIGGVGPLENVPVYVYSPGRAETVPANRFKLLPIPKFTWHFDIANTGPEAKVEQARQWLLTPPPHTHTSSGHGCIKRLKCLRRNSVFLQGVWATVWNLTVLHSMLWQTREERWKIPTGLFLIDDNLCKL